MMDFCLVWIITVHPSQFISVGPPQTTSSINIHLISHSHSLLGIVSCHLFWWIGLASSWNGNFNIWSLSQFCKYWLIRLEIKLYNNGSYGWHVFMPIVKEQNSFLVWCSLSLLQWFFFTNYLEWHNHTIILRCFWEFSVWYTTRFVTDKTMPCHIIVL